MLGAIDNAFLNSIRGSGGEDRLRADWSRVALAYAEAMLAAQLMEFAVRIAGPALRAPVDDEALAREEVQAGRHRKLHHAAGMLQSRLRSEASLTTVGSRLDSATTMRNELAHDFWLSALPRTLAGDADTLVAELEESTAIFGEVVSELLARVFPRVLDARGIEEPAINAVVATLVQALMSGAVPSHLPLIDDGDEVLQILALLASGTSTG